MDGKRFEELKAKAAADGLSDEEAAELGHMYAEEAGEPYSDAADMAKVEQAAIEADERARRDLEAGQEAQAAGESHRAQAAQPGVAPDAGPEKP